MKVNINFCENGKNNGGGITINGEEIILETNNGKSKNKKEVNRFLKQLSKLLDKLRHIRVSL